MVSVKTVLTIFKVDKDTQVDNRPFAFLLNDRRIKNAKRLV